MTWVQDSRPSWACGAAVYVYRVCVMDLSLGDTEFFVARANIFSHSMKSEIQWLKCMCRVKMVKE